MPDADHATKLAAWRFGWFDHDGQWGFSETTAAKHQEILVKLGYWEQKTWAQIMSEDPKSQHSCEVTSLIPEAQDRLKEKKLDDYDSLFRFRLTGRERLWGILNGNIFYVLWWDPGHAICPSTKRHT